MRPRGDAPLSGSFGLFMGPQVLVVSPPPPAARAWERRIKVFFFLTGLWRFLFCVCYGVRHRLDQNDTAAAAWLGCLHALSQIRLERTALRPQALGAHASCRFQVPARRARGRLLLLHGAGLASRSGEAREHAVAREGDRRWIASAVLLCAAGRRRFVCPPGVRWPGVCGASN